MVEMTTLATEQPWVQLKATESDWENVDSEWILSAYKEIFIIRAFEETMLTLSSEDLVNGPMHSSIGQEGGAVGSAGLLRSTDAVNGTHRGHHQFLAKSLSYLAARTGLRDLDNTSLPDEVGELLYRTMAEILGLRDGFSGGRGGSMHLRWAEAGCLGTNAIVGGGVPLAVGHSWGQGHRAAGDSNVTFTYFGDGASNIGSVLESLNLAAAWRTPTCFFVENNMYAVSTHIEEVSSETRISARASGFGIPAWRVDGMDPLAVKLATELAVEMMRRGNGPTLIEADVYRYYHQNGAFAGSAFGYRSREEEKAWKARDPLPLMKEKVLGRKIWSEAQIEEFELGVRKELEVIVDRLIDGTSRPRSIREELWPLAETVDDGTRSTERALKDLAPLDPNAPVRTLRCADAIAETLLAQMEKNQNIILLGEDIHRLNGGTNGATRGLPELFPDRVLGTPISENAFTGFAGGLAAAGEYRPVVEFMFADFVLVAADQLFNQIGKMRHMFGDTASSPVVVRIKVGTGKGYGSQHSMDPASFFANFPGWRIVAPSTPADYVGALNTALTGDDPVAILEHEDLYEVLGEVPEGPLTFGLPLRSAAVRVSGSKVTVIGFMSIVRELEKVITEDSLDVDLLDLRWLDADSLDWQTIEESIKKTNRVIIVDQSTSTSTYGAWLGYEIQRRFFDYLDAPIERITAGESSPTISKALERASLPSSEVLSERIAQLARQSELGLGGA